VIGASGVQSIDR